MGRIRLFAALLALLSVLAGFWVGLAQGSWIDAGVLILAAACLAAVCPFDAPTPPQRTRVAIACTAHVVLTGLAIVHGYTRDNDWSTMIPLFLLLEAGVGLAGWAFATRKRSRLAGSRRYYDF